MKTDTFGKIPVYIPTHEQTAVKDAAESSALGKYTRSFGLSLAITSVLSCLLVVEKELHAGLMNLMKAATPHHWITHGLFNVLVFVVIGFALAQLNGGTGVRVSAKGIAAAIVGSALVSVFVIAGFYLIHG